MEKTELVTFKAADGLELDGLWCEPNDPVGVSVVHVHGKGGNFFRNAFLRVMYEILPARGIGILGFNNRGAGGIVEGFRSGDLVYVGSALENLASASLDIDSALSFVGAMGYRTVLQGHSHGCEKILHWLTGSSSSATPVVLLSPANSRALHYSFSAEEPNAQVAGLRRSARRDTWDLASPSRYGIACGDLRYPIPITRPALLELLLSGDMDWFARGYTGAKFANSSLILVGEKDPLQMGDPEQTLSAACSYFSKTDGRLVPSADHRFSGQETMLAMLVVEWIVDRC